MPVSHAALIPEVLVLGLSKSQIRSGELGLAILSEPFVDHWIFLGPRLMGLTTPEFSMGAEATLWFVNAIGPGIAADYLFSSKKVRLEGNLGLRVLHLGDDGALSLRFGFFHESQAELGLKGGITLQFSGISTVETVP